MNTALFFITHDGIASNMLRIGEAVIGRPVHNIGYHEVAMDSSVLDAMNTIEGKLSTLELDDSLVFVTDIIGATPSNIARELANKYQAPLISGLSLPMVIRLFNYRENSHDELIQRALDGARESILEVSPE